MAAEVPAGDILCEAMEYLSKLGSNLRTRSENLKEKRISKGKLRNSHAVQKAANKVLLICELSKKSLDNVETGVRRVLSLLEASQAPSSSGGRTDVKNRESKKKYHYFEYKSKKLRIAKKIPLKHYMSVKVLATPMSTSMQDKYPVYYNCKLKRKRLAAMHISNQKRRSVSCSDKEQECVKINSSDDEEADEDKKEDSDTNIDKSDKKSPKTDSESQGPLCENDKVNMSIDDSVVEIEDKASSKEGSDIDHDITVSKKKMSRKSSIDSSDNDNLITKKSEKRSPKKSKEQKHKTTNKTDWDKNKKAKRIRFADVYSSDSDKESQKEDITKKGNISVDEENVEDSVDLNRNSEYEPKSKKLKLINNDSNSQLDSDGGVKPSTASKENEDSENDSQSKQGSDNDSTKSKNCEGSQTESGGETKPFIRCVNLSKLLKPDVLDKNDKLKNDQSLKNNESSLTKNYILFNKKDRNNKNDNKVSKSKQENDVEFWAQKRKEVREFKPKKCSIKIDRLPNLTISYLLANNLKKIVKKGKVICEVTNENDTPNKIEAVKTALLIDSESDDGGEKDNASKVKQSLVKHFDSDNTTDIKQRKQSNKIPEENKLNNRASPELEKVTNDNCTPQLESNNDITNEISKGIEKSRSTEKNLNHSGDDECRQSDTNIPGTPTKTKKSTSLIDSFNDSSDDFAGFSKSDIESPIKTSNTIKSFLLNDSSDEESKSTKKKLSTKANEEIKSSLLHDSSDENSDKNKNDSLTKANERSKCSLLNKSSDEKSNKNDNDSHSKRRRLAKANDKSKSSLLNDTSDENTNKSEDDSHTKANEKSKSSLLNDSSDERPNKNDDDDDDDDSHVKTNKNSKSSLLNESSDEKSNKSGDDSSAKANDKIKSSLLNESSDEKSNKSGDDSSAKANDKTKSSLLNESSDEKSNKSGDDSSAKANDKIKSSLLNESSDEKSNKSGDDSSAKANDKTKSSLLNESSDEKSNKSGDDSSAKANDKTKSSLLNESSDEKSNKSGDDSSAKANDKTKSSLSNQSSDEKSKENGDKPDTKTDENSKSPVSNDSSHEKSNKNEGDSPTKTNEKLKSSLLNDSSDEKSNKNVEESPTKTNEKSKSSLLNDSSDEKSNKNEEDSPTKAKEKLKSALLNDSSDVKSDDTDGSREKQKTPKAKRKHARKSREARKNLRFDSSSESEQEMPRQRRRKGSHVANTSSSSDDTKKKIKKKKSRKSRSDSNASGDNKSIDQIDGAVDELSNSSVKKMVRSKAKPSGSSSQNSDNQDASDKDIDGLTNLNSLNKIRRRDTSGKSRDEDRKREKKTSRSKPTPIIGEDLLKSESSSDGSDDVQNDIDQDLPPVILPGLNGDGIDHLAKDDLLGDSDSSMSHDKEQSENPSNSDDEANVKLKRRKANAISSDSEGGSNRRKIKDKDVKMSDFEDSETESSEPKKAKRKTRVTDSDASGDSNDEGKKKRRRIKVVKDSDASGSDTENEGRNKHGRKNIRKVMGKNQLEEATKKAAREEKERIARITERQKLYNNLDFDESGKPDEVVLDKVILDFDPETKEPLIQVDRGLVKKLKPHQANGIKFMWDACFESVKRIKKDRGSGCILAHCMGLGKTLQVISLTHTLLTHGDLTGVNRVLVVCPLSTVLNWVNEFKMWLKHAVTDFEVDVYELSRYKQNSERAFQLQQWFDGGGVCVLGYEMFRNLSADNNKKFKKKIMKSFQESLVEPGPDLVVCDEGHLLKNEKTSLSQSMNKVKTRRRIVLTGTPLQNNLKEYYCMVQFVKPNLLGKYNEYLNRFVNPITNGQYTDSTEHDIRVMKRRSHVLHKMLDGAVQRRDYGVLAPFLPPKHEYVLFITLTEVQVKLYQFYLDNYSRRPLPGKSSGFLFPDFQSLQRIWTHPLVLKYNSERYEIMQQKKRDREEEDSEGSLVDFIDDDSTPDESSSEESSDDLSDMSDDSRKKSKKKKSAKKSKGKESKASTRRGTRANPVELEDEENVADDVVEVKNENPTEWWIKLVEETELDDMRNSHKLVLLFDILRQCETIGDKLLVFSQSLYSLDLIEHFLGKVDEATQEGRIDEKLGGHVGSWSPGVDYFRLDGSTSCENRSIWCKNFNREDNPRARLFLISTRAGGLGINLVAANRVVIFDVSWNPSHDVQSIFRVYRFGQKKPCYVYRFLAMGTMEEKIYERQVTKQAISKRVIDEQQIDRHYAENDLAELYKFEAIPDEPRPLPPLPKDRLFAEMLREHEKQIYKYHEHDSLLENKEEETLSEEERKAAWEDFENEKNKPPPAPFPSAWPMHNGMVPGLLAQQQQQLAYAALAAMLRKDMPNINDNQIRDMLPLIYNSNPGMFGGYDYGLMQKMGDIYKYAQPGMMNPGMMNAVMNAGTGAAGAGAGALGGSSGLQYEPPWQRQQQQQQQMRLQQLMQHQNQMGAKFYAGGLGSRDPIAMALQQQRAREIMMGGGAGRPRGRPPIHPRPTTTDQDVVNLDSD